MHMTTDEARLVERVRGKKYELELVKCGGEGERERDRERERERERERVNAF